MQFQNGFKLAEEIQLVVKEKTIAKQHPINIGLLGMVVNYTKIY